jgi:hypothetical protein
VNLVRKEGRRGPKTWPKGTNRDISRTTKRGRISVTACDLTRETPVGPSARRPFQHRCRPVLPRKGPGLPVCVEPGKHSETETQDLHHVGSEIKRIRAESGGRIKFEVVIPLPWVMKPLQSAWPRVMDDCSLRVEY